MDILIFGGQSNMQGETDALPAPNPTIENALEYRYLSDSLVPLCHPVGEDIGEDKMLAGAHKGHGSLIPAFCRSYTKTSGRKAVAVHAARGSTVLADWMPSTARYELAKKKILSAVKKVSETETVGKIYYIWLQGESDAIIKTPEAEYLKMLTEYQAALKADVGIDLFGIIRVGYFTANENDDEAIMRAQDKAATQDGFAMLTDVCAALSKDPTYLNPFWAGHYNNAGMDKIGETAGRALALLFK